MSLSFVIHHTVDRVGIISIHIFCPLVVFAITY